MSELELQLTQLGRELDFPEPPDVAAGACRRRIGRARAGAFWRRRALRGGARALRRRRGGGDGRAACAQRASSTGSGSAAPRSASSTSCPRSRRSGSTSGSGVSLERAHELAPGLLDPHVDGLGAPGRTSSSRTTAGTPVTYVWGDADRPRLLLTQVRGTLPLREARSCGGARTSIGTEVNGADAAWIEGRARPLLESGRTGGALPSRLARSTLVWSRGPVTLRLEGDLTQRGGRAHRADVR